MKFLLYGANGFTAQLIIDLADQYGLTPVLAGRDGAKIKALTESRGLEHIVFGLDDPDAMDAALRGFSIVLHCAGPFIHTGTPMMEACMRTGVHYVDIAGEIEVFERAAKLDGRAKAAKVMLLPGAGLDVVPTDCLALYLKNQVPDAENLQLAIGSPNKMSVSRGTMMTMVETLGEGGYWRRDGALTKIPVGEHRMTVPFSDTFTARCSSLPWGDVATAYYTTGIPNIESFYALPDSTARALRWGAILDPLMRSPSLRDFIRRRIDRTAKGPDDKEQGENEIYIWGKVWNESGKAAEARMRCPEPYRLTAQTSLLIIQKILQGNFRTGFQTPAGCYGPDLIMEIEGVRRENITRA